MHIRNLILPLLAVMALVCGLSGAQSAQTGVVWNNVGVCDPLNPNNCLAPTSGGIPTTTINGGNVTQGTTTDSAYVSGAGTVISILKGIFSNTSGPIPSGTNTIGVVGVYAAPANSTSGVTAAMTGTTSTSLLAAPAGGLRNYLTQFICTNSHATVGTFVLVQDGSGGTTIYEAYAAAVGGGFSITLPMPLRQPTTATALFVQDVTTGSNVICSGSGYTGG